jgi:aspartate aminotransferase
MADRVQELKEKRDLTVSLLKGIPNVSTPPADGAFYLLPDVSAYFGKKTPDASGTIIGNSHDLCLQLLEKYQVALVPGDAFGADDCIRISYAASEDTIRVSMQKLKDFLISLVP